MGGGPIGPQGGLTTLQGHGLWKTAPLMSPLILHARPCPQPVQGSLSPRGAPGRTFSGPCSSICVASSPALRTNQLIWPTHSGKLAPPARGCGV